MLQFRGVRRAVHGRRGANPPDCSSAGIWNGTRHLDWSEAGEANTRRINGVIANLFSEQRTIFSESATSSGGRTQEAGLLT